MDSTDLSELKAYWAKKYPTVSISIYPKVVGGKFLGNIMNKDSRFDLMANTIGELITQGEAILRKVS